MEGYDCNNNNNVKDDEDYYTYLITVIELFNH